MRALLTLVILMAMANSTVSAEPGGIPAKGLGFEAWENGRPSGWYVVESSGHSISQDCEVAHEGRCSMRVTGKTPFEKGFLTLSQNIPVASAAGHRLKLSGWIRTRDLEKGWAGLWLRVDAPRGPHLAFDNMEKTGPRGTTEWQPFEISVPVAPNAKAIVFGVLTSGSGDSWFDDLKLSVDKSIVVPAAELPPMPPRPQPSQALATDAELALAAGDIPAHVSEALKADVRSRAHPIRSLFSDDFSDLQFLKPLLEGRRIVQLGESSHGVAEFNWMKARLIRFLHREMGFDVVAFESSLSGCDVADAEIGIKRPIDVMRDCIFAVWHSSETLGVFEYLDAERKAGSRISLAGFDTQNSGGAQRAVRERLVAYAALVDPELAKRIETAEGALRQKLPEEEAVASCAAYVALAKDLEKNRAVLAPKSARPFDIDLAIQEARSRVKFVDQLAATTPMRGTPIRDEGMADNLDFLADRMFPGRKIIVWAHNGHIAKEFSYPNAPRMMGNHVASRRGAETYTVGLYMGRGMSTTNDRALVEIAAPPADSLEAIIASAGWRMSFVDFTRSPSEWMLSKMIGREWGRHPLQIVPAKTYDAVIYIDRVGPPEYR